MTNVAASLMKYAPLALDYTEKTPWREITNSEGLGYIANSLNNANPVKLTHLRVRVNLGATDAQVKFTNKIKSFFKALHTYEHCTHLDLQHCQLSDHTCRDHLGPMLEQNRYIVSLDLCDNAFTDAGANIIFESLAYSVVGNLLMARNALTYASMDTAKNVIATDKFEKIDFSYTEIGAEGIKILAPVMKPLRNLKHLLLESCKLGDEGCVELADNIYKEANKDKSTPEEQGFENLEKLNLALNHIGRVGVGKLVACFVPGKNDPVKELDLSKNYFGDEGFQCVMDMMQQNNKMTSLKLNRVGVTKPKFASFCEKLLGRYEQEFGPYPELTNLEVGGNGLGNEFAPLFSMLQHKNCIIESVNYEANEVTDFGAKLLKDWLKDPKKVKARRTEKDKGKASDTKFINAQRRANEERRSGHRFRKLSLKLNAITADGCEHLAELVTGGKDFTELDLRKNKIGVKGAIFFKKAFRKLQCPTRTCPKLQDNFLNLQDRECLRKKSACDCKSESECDCECDCEECSETNRTFKLHILPDDVTVEGVNHLAIGLREHPKVLDAWIKNKRKDDKYERTPEFEAVWKAAVFKNPETKDLVDNKEADGKETTESVPTSKGNAPGDKTRWMTQLNRTKFHEFDTPRVNKENRFKIHKFKYGIEIYGENDEKEDTWGPVKKMSYQGFGVVETNRGIYKWNPMVWSLVKQGWGCVVANTLYRYGLLLRFQYQARSMEYIQDQYFNRFSKSSFNPGFMRFIDTREREELVARLVTEDIKEFWEVLMHQTCEKSEGLTMFEFVLKYAKSPVIDCVRQFLNVFPSEAYRRKGSKYPAVFLQQVIAQSGETYRDLCLKSQDRFVRRYAEAKKLVLFRFLEVEPVYISKFVRITKVEDLLLTEEYNDDERFFYMRRIAATSAQNDEKLAANEYDAHRSFMKSEGKYLSNSGATSVDKVENLILTNINIDLDASFYPQISPLLHKKQVLNDDKLMPTFTKIYKTNLREVLDNESLAGGRDLARAQIMLRMIANSLEHFNKRDWAKERDGATDEVKKARIHGNIKPRNIILRVADELPDLDKGTDLMPGKWVLSDFSRSTPHDTDYIPIKDSAYNPPEIAKRIMASGEAHLKCKFPAKEAMDVWQFGCVLYEVLAGTTLFKMEGNNDLIIDEEERGELINWLSLDEERADLILNQLKAHKSSNGGYKNSYISMSLNNWGNYDDDEIEQIIESGKQLVAMCLQGRPEDRPSFADILAHPFLLNVDVGRTWKEKDADKILPTAAAGWDNAGFLSDQPHVHLVNTDFEEAGLLVKSLEEKLNQSGCRLTTDAVGNSTPEEYEKDMRKYVQSARVIACLLTSDAFHKPSVVKQLLFAEDYRKKVEKVHGRVLFIDLNGGVDLSKNNLQWKKETFSKWTEGDSYAYLVNVLAEENPSFKTFSVGQVNHRRNVDAWNNFLQGQFKEMVLSYLQDPIKYQSSSFLSRPMLDRMLTDGHMVATENISKFKIPEMADKNYSDPADLLNKKMKDTKDKFMNLYFLPAHRVRKGNVRVYILCMKDNTEETFQAVSQMARALEAPSSLNLVKKENRHKEKTDPRNKLINKVKTSYNIKKDSHLKATPRITHLQLMKDKVMNVERQDGALLLVLYCSKGVFKRYSSFLHEAVEKRDKGMAVVLVKAPGFDVGNREIKREIEEFVPDRFKDEFLDKDRYLPYYKPKKHPWQYEATMKHLLKTAVHKLENPTPKENFKEIKMEA